MNALTSILLRSIPEVARTGLADGELAVFGSVIRSTTTGQIAYHLQETSALAQSASTMLMPGGLALEGAKVASQVAGDTMLYRQGQQIKAAVDLLSEQQWTNLLLSGATLGVSVAGFAVLANRISQIEGHIASFDRQLAALKNSIDSLRQDRVAEDLSLLRTMSQQMEETWSLRDPSFQLGRVASESHALANRFFDRALALLNGDGPRLALAAPMFDAFGLAQSIRVAARICDEETEAAVRATAEIIGQYDELLEKTDATQDLLAMLREEDVCDVKDLPSHIDALFNEPLKASAALRSRAEAMEVTRELIATLTDNGMSGREFIEAARSEQEVPVLFVSATYP